MFEHVMLLSIPGLRPGDIYDPQVTPTLYRLANDGAYLHLLPTFPCVTSPVQASMLTGCTPDRHGVIANGFYYPDRGEVAFWTGGHDEIKCTMFFTRLARERPGLTSAAWCAQNIKGADATYIVTPAPIHKPDGSVRSWCYSKPDGLYEELLRPLGDFPLQHYWGPLAGIQSTRWIAEGALWLARTRAPNFQFIYLPHLDYANQKYGPNSHEASAALSELDAVIGDMITRYQELPAGKSAAWIIAGEYAFTSVSGAVFPNRMLRQAGLLRVRELAHREYLDLAGSDAFAMVDHQFAHVFVNRGDPEAVAELFAHCDDISDIVVGRERGAMHVEHPRSAPVILISRPDRWLAYYWWLDDAAAPPFARTVDIHAKPGYDPVELFMDPATRQIPLDASLVKGSHGAPAATPEQQALLISMRPELLEHLPLTAQDTDVYGVLCRAFGLEPVTAGA